MAEHRFGTVALVGRPNVGKSTLLNALVGARLSIVTPRPQTTRNRIAGIRTRPGAQVVLLDTPGVPTSESRLNRRLRRIVRKTREEADVLVVVIDATSGLRPLDRQLIGDGATVVAVSKIDAVPKPTLLPLLAEIGALAGDAPIVPVSGLDGTQLDALLDEIIAHLPSGAARFDAESYTTASRRFLAQEIVREQVFLQTRQEIPYGSAVVVESFDESDPACTRIAATILVSRESHKGMVIGAGGSRLGTIGRAARAALEDLLGAHVYLDCLVRVESDWLDRPDRLDALELA
jgi:GTP-binding protein Era